MKYLLILALVASLAACSSNVGASPAPIHWQTYHGVPVAIVDGQVQLSHATIRALQLAGVDTSNLWRLRANILRGAD